MQSWVAKMVPRRFSPSDWRTKFHICAPDKLARLVISESTFLLLNNLFK